MNISPNSITPDDLKHVLEKLALGTLQKNFQEIALLVTCKGYLSGLTSSNYNKHYRVVLSHNSSIYLDIPSNIVKGLNLCDGLYVCVVGHIVSNYFQSQLEFRLDVSQVEILESPEEVIRKNQERIDLDRLKSLADERHLFPKKIPCTLALIYPRSNQSQVNQDFLTALKFENIKDCFVIKETPINVLNAEELSAAINNCRDDIIVIIRGGGDSSQFEVFDQKIVVEAFSRYPGYRVCGLGHTAQFTLLDRLADFSANTPTAAGYHLREQFTEIAWLHYKILLLEKNRGRWRKAAKFSIVTLALLLAACGIYNHNHSKVNLLENIPAVSGSPIAHHSVIKRNHHNKSEDDEGDDLIDY